jgi:hypothetical protein
MGFLHDASNNMKKTLFVFFVSLFFVFFVPTGDLYAQTSVADANSDGIVDGIDYLIWAVHYGLTTSNGKQDGDFNTDLVVNGIDYVVFLQNYGTIGSTPTSTVSPNPTQAQTGNIARNKTVTASSHDTDAPNPQAVVDGSTTTRWSSAWSQPQWIQIDLGQSYTISRVVLNWQAAYGSGYRIETSEDASTWATVYATSTGNGAIDDLSGLNGHGRYVRMYGTQRACDTCGGKLYGFSLWEFEVYAVGSGSTSTPSPTRNPSVSPTKTPTPIITGTTTCFVKVAGVIYNLQPAVGIKLVDPNTKKTQTHSRSDFKCGTLDNPTDMTNTYLSKHLKMGCAQRLAPYIYTLPAPEDPTCQ